MLPLLSLTWGLAFLSGLNLYLATALASIAVRSGWVDASLHPALEFLGHPALLTVALVMFVVEFFTDKIPWVDSLWDLAHTAIRPLGAAAVTWGIAGAAGLENPTALGVTAVAGFVALCTHLTKSGVRLLINASPEPVTNILASLAEDIAVLLLMLLLINAPVTGFAACLVLLAVTWITLPRLFRLVRTSVYLMWKKVFGSAPTWLHTGRLPASLTSRQETLLTETAGPDATPAAWTLGCAAGKSHGLPSHKPNRFGTLIAPAHHPGTLVFIRQGWFGGQGVRFSLAGASVRRESTFLSENLVIHRADDGFQATFRFTRAEGPLVARLVADLQSRLGLAAPGTSSPVLSPPLTSGPGLDSPAALPAWITPPPLQH
jgi:hypothetical protein